jgi:hypothetical protein
MSRFHSLKKVQIHLRPPAPIGVGGGFHHSTQDRNGMSLIVAIHSLIAVQINARHLQPPQQYTHLHLLLWDLRNGPVWTIPKTLRPSQSQTTNLSHHHDSHHQILGPITTNLYSQLPHCPFATCPLYLPHLWLSAAHRHLQLSATDRHKLAYTHTQAHDLLLDLRVRCTRSLALVNYPILR